MKCPACESLPARAVLLHLPLEPSMTTLDTLTVAHGFTSSRSNISASVRARVSSHQQMSGLVCP